jgi:mannose-6-phosphate isomerase
MRDVELGWVDGFLDGVWSSWRTHADQPNGIFQPYLDREWRPQGDGPRTLVSQCRLVYNFARAFEHTRDQGYAALVRRGLAALSDYFATSDEGGYAWSCHPDGRVADETFDAYGHAFVVLALATAATCLDEPRYRDAALRTWAFMQRRFGDTHGGLIWHVARNGRIVDEVRSQNPLMHTFEALLTLAPLDAGGTVLRDAAAIWHFLQARLLGPGCLPEWYDPTWHPARAEERAIVEIGHAFEWAFLLSEAQTLLPGEDLLGAGRQFLDYGMRHGYDAEAGGIYSQVNYDGSLRRRRKGWWEQCEALRAISRYVVRHDSAELVGPLRQSLTFVRENYVDATYGGWYEAPPGMGDTVSLMKGHPFKLDYHVVNMCRELLQIG